MSPTPLTALAAAKAFKGPHESFIPKLCTICKIIEKEKKMEKKTVSWN